MPSKQLLRILKVFDVCGFCTSCSILSRKRNCRNTIYLVHILIALSLTLFKIYLVFNFYSDMAFAEAISEFLQYAVSLSTYWIIIVDSIVHQKQHRHFWAICHRINSKFASQSDLTFLTFRIQFGEYFVAAILTFGLRCWIISDAFYIQVEIAFSTLIKLCQVRLFYYLFCLEIVHSQFTIVENEFKVTLRVHRQQRAHSIQIFNISKIESFEQQRLKWVREYFACVYEMSEGLKIFFGWSHVAVVLSCFYIFLTEFNWIYVHYDEFSPIHLFGEIEKS